MAYTASIDAKKKFVGGAKFQLFCPENCNFAHNFKSIAAMRLILVPSISKWPMPVTMVQKWNLSGVPFLQNLGFFFTENCNFAHNFKGIAAMRLILVPFIQKRPMPVPMVQKWNLSGVPFLPNLGLVALKIAMSLITSKVLQLWG